MTPRLRTLLVSIALSLASTLSAQTSGTTIGSTYLWMCAGVARPTMADSLKRYVPQRTMTGSLCFRRDTVAAIVAPRDTVVLLPTPTPVPVPTPTGWTLVTTLGPTLPLTGGFRIAYDASSVTAAIDPSGLPALAMRFPAGMPSGESPATVYYEPLSATRVRIESRVAYPVNYVRHPSGVDKQVFVTVGAYNSFFTMMYGAEHYAAVGLQGLASNYTVNGVTGQSVNLVQNMNQSLSTGRLVYGRRHAFDCEITSGSSGTVNCWLDGVQIMSYSGIPFRAGPVSAVAYAPIWGGAGPSLAVAQSVYLGSLRVLR